MQTATTAAPVTRRRRYQRLATTTVTPAWARGKSQGKCLGCQRPLGHTLADRCWACDTTWMARYAAMRDGVAA